MRTFRWRGSAALLSFALAASVGCGHTKTEIPGVFDFRSDASGATAAKDPPKFEDRGAMGFLVGDGIEVGEKSAVTIEERRWWVIGLVPVGDHDVKDEIKTATAGVAMRRVSVGEEETVLDWVYQFASRYIPFVGQFSWIVVTASPLTVNVKGERVELGTANTPLDVPMTEAPSADAPADGTPPPANTPAP